MDWSNFTFIKEGHIWASPCIEMVAFSSGSPKSSGPSFDRALRVFSKSFGNQFTFFRTGDMTHFQPFDNQTLETPFHWFKSPKILGKKMLGIVIHSGETELELRPPAIKLSLWGFDDPTRFVFRFVLPVESGNSPDDILSLAQDAFADFPLDSGHCGYSFLWNESDISTEREVLSWSAPLLLKHPGIGYGDAFMLSNATDRGIVAVSWLTFLGPSITTTLGGKEALKRRLPEGVTSYSLGSSGIILRAGHAPDLGDVSCDDRLDSYRAIGSLVAPCRTSDEAFEDVVMSGMSDENAYKWLRRFFT